MKKRPSLTIAPAPDCIEIRGVRQNNLKGFDLDLPLGRLIVVSGPSGSGKSSLAFDTVYAEGQRRYVETFSPYTRQFLDRMDKPRVDSIRGIPPAIAIEQSNPVKTTRSTVGTITEINDYLKVLLPRVVAAHCPSCTREVRPETAPQIVAESFARFAGEAVLVTFGVPAPPGTKAADFFAFLAQQGYLRVWLGGEIVRTDESRDIGRLPAVVAVIQDRVTIDAENRARFTEAIETALRFGKGRLAVHQLSNKSHHPFSSSWHCAHCDIDIAPPTPGLFSFNSPLGACPACRGFGRIIGLDIHRAIPDRTLSIAEGVVKPFQTENGRECQRDLLRAAAAKDVDVRAPFRELPEPDQRWVLEGEDPKREGEDLWKEGLWYGVRGFFRWLESKSYKMHVRVLLSRYRTYTTCPDCGGGRFQPATLNFRFAGKTLPELTATPIDELLPLLAIHQSPLADSSLKTLHGEVASRLRYLVEVGLGYLSLDRPTRTLSGGELERVNLTTCLGAALVNTLFVLDEPSIGLHPRDTARLIRIMRELRDRGNTLLVVEHEESVIRAADHLVELGPGRGEAGGELVYSGALPALLRRRKTTLTGEYLTGRKSIPLPTSRRAPADWLHLRAAREHNLRGIDVAFPLGVFCCVTGVSGSGKSTLVHQVLYENLLRLKGIASDESAGACDGIECADRVEQVVMVDQSPLARTPRSNSALYLGVFDTIREMFAMTDEARAQGLTASAFSFNSGTGRCERCSGAGFEKIEMQFLSDVYLRCPECEGRRYQPHVLEILLAGKSIADVLEMTVTEAIQFFGKHPTSNTQHPTSNGPRGRATAALDVGCWMLDVGRCSQIASRLALLDEVGLGYLRLGQPLNVLSGGESQRLKLVERLANQSENRCLLIFDEPTTGLHFDDVALLVRALQRLVEQGHTALVIEHNIEVIKCADWIIDLGPEAGAGGGLVVAKGTPEEVAGVEESHTGRFLRGALNSKLQTPNSKLQTEADEGELRVAEAARSEFRIQNSKSICVRGAREHNLKNLSLDIPRDRLVVVTGLSGSGKSTLAFDLLFAEGQRRFLDSMSAYARQFVEQLEKPDVDSITGLPPSVAIEQRITRGGGKSTVATVTEVYHFLRLLFSKLGTQHCPKCDLAVEKQSVAAIVEKAGKLAKRGRLRVLATLVKARKGFHTEIATWARKQGFEDMLVDGVWVKSDAFPKLERFREHTIDVLVGERRGMDRLRPLVERALEIGRGTARLLDARGGSTVVSTERSCAGCGLSFEALDPRLFSFNSPHGWCAECRGFGEVWQMKDDPRLESQIEIDLDRERRHETLDVGEAKPCPQCAGARLNPEARAVRVGGSRIAEIAARPSQEALAWVEKLKFTGAQKMIAQDILPEIAQRLTFLAQVGLDYLSLDRSARTLSGGESQRIRLAAQLGSNLRGVLYVLDEPTIGLHARDNVRLLDTLEALRARGNSLVVVEHDEETMRRADHIIDLGPGAGRHGGEVVAQGTLREIERADTATGRAMREPLRHPTRGTRRSLGKETRWLEVRGAALHNLKALDARFPLGRLTVLTGVSGSGKSTLMRGVVKPAVTLALARKGKRPASNVQRSTFKEASVSGAEGLEAVYEVDQSPIGKTSRSTPATYLGVFDDIRALYAATPLARMRGYSASRFSFNTNGGRCEACAGQGVIKVEMQFLPASHTPCHDCHGKRYNAATLEVLYNDASIGDVMGMTLERAADFFSAHAKVQRPLALLCETGLGYLQLGQASPTLSGGEAQRLKLVTELVRGIGRSENARLRRNETGRGSLYLLEEPTIGLHLADVQRLLDVLHRLVDAGHTVVVIEHHLNVIADADYVIDLGPEAGAGGGEIVAAGTPEEVALCKRSQTAPFLREVLAVK